MSKTVKINGVTYSGISQVLLPLADGTGNAVFKEDSGGGGGDTTPALYPFAYSHIEGAASKKTVSNGNHIKILSTANGITTVNLPHSIPILITTRSFEAIYMPYPIIPSGTEVTISIKNVTENVDGYAVGVTAPGGNADMNNSPLGEDGGSITGTNGRKTYTFTTAAATQISSFYIVFMGNGNADIEFDLELTVGGVRWI